MINFFLRGIFLLFTFRFTILIFVSFFHSFSFSFLPNAERNILSSVHYEKLYQDFYKKIRADEITLARSRGEINQDSEAKVFLLLTKKIRE